MKSSFPAAASLSHIGGAISEDKPTECVCEANRHFSEELEMNTDVVEQNGRSFIDEARLSNFAHWQHWPNLQAHSRRLRTKAPAVANHRGEIRPECIRKVVNSIFELLSTRQKRHLTILNRTFNRRPINVAIQAGCPCTPVVDGEHLKPRGKCRDLVQQELSDDPRLCIAGSPRFFVLLCGNFRGLSRCSPSKHGDHERQQSDECRHNNSPTGPKHRALRLHRKALSKSQSHPVVSPIGLEPILP